MRALPHPLETARLAALRARDIVDTPPEAAFDDIASLAAALCAAPVALVSLVEEQRQWFKAATGIDLASTSRDSSICAHAILGDDVLVIPDTSADPRTADNPLCTGEEPVAAYLGAPVRTPDGLPLGTLCVIDRTPRDFDEGQIAAMRVLARVTGELIEARRAVARAETARRETDHRVKNSLQSVAGLIRIKRRAMAEPAAQSALSALETRIGTVAALHEALSLSEVGGRIALAPYLDRIGALLSQEARDGIAFVTEIEPAEVAPELASAVGVVVNECVVNAARHAFPREAQGTIRVTGRYEGPERYVIECADDGVGAGGADSATAGTGLGFEIIEATLAQIGAEKIDTATQGGSALAFAFDPRPAADAEQPASPALP